MTLPAQGRVLGIDVGYSTRAATTGLCLLSWDRAVVRARCENATSARAERLERLRDLLGPAPETVLAVAVDGPLAPRLREVGRYRCADALLTCGKFRRRGKPSPTNGGSGPRLHAEATRLARLVRDRLPVAEATYTPRIDRRAIVEAFPNMFLGVLCDERGYPEAATSPRRWTDTLYCARPWRGRMRRRVQALVGDVLGRRRLAGDWDVDDHDKVAALVCAVSALCVAAGRFVAVGRPAVDGFIALPPAHAWGPAADGATPWAARELRANLARPILRRRFPDPELWSDGRRWTP